MSKLIDIIVEYNKLSQNDKELFKQVIDTPSEKSNEKSKEDMSNFRKRMAEESVKKYHTRINDITRPYDLTKPFDPSRQVQLFGSLQHATN